MTKLFNERNPVLAESNYLAQELLRERRKDRLYKNLRGFLWMALILAIVLMARNGDDYPGGDVDTTMEFAAVIDLDGSILPGSESASFKGLQGTLKKAFQHPWAKGVVLRVNSPGGSPVQSDLIRAELIRLKQKHDKRLIVVGEEMLTSGAYMVAMAADAIYTNPATIVGSIGVRMDNFGAVGLIDKVGVERRVYSSGKNKVGLDPFLPEEASDVAHVNSVLDQIHEQFIRVVEEGRGDALADSKELFSGMYWTGEKAVSLGLVDGNATLHEAVASEFGIEKLEVFRPDLNVWGRISNFVSGIHQAMSAFDSSASVVKARFDGQYN